MSSSSEHIRRRLPPAPMGLNMSQPHWKLPKVQATHFRPSDSHHTQKQSKTANRSDVLAVVVGSVLIEQRSPEDPHVAIPRNSELHGAEGQDAHLLEKKFLWSSQCFDYVQNQYNIYQSINLSINLSIFLPIYLLEEK